MLIILSWRHTRGQARSQDLKIGGGFFERVRKLQTTLTRIFIVLESESHGLSENWDGISRKTRKFKRFFSPNQVISPPKKKGLHRNWDGFFGQNRKFRRFFSPNQVISPPQKKRSSPKLSRIFQPKSENQTLFQAESWHLLHNFGTQFPLGGCLHFFTKNRLQKHQKRAILHTLQANEGFDPPPPPGYATAGGPGPMPPLNTPLSTGLQSCFNGAR